MHVEIDVQIAPLTKAASDSGMGSRPFLVRGNALASHDAKDWLLSVFRLQW